jgi:hypothetical protein
LNATYPKGEHYFLRRQSNLVDANSVDLGLSSFSLASTWFCVAAAEQPHGA